MYFGSKSILYAASILAAGCQAFNPLKPEYLDEDKKFLVSSKKHAPSGFKAVERTADNRKSTSNNKQTTVSLGDGMTFMQTDSNNEAYWVEAEIGKSQLPLLLDTGSPYLWVYSSDCKDSSCTNRQLYKPDSSSSSSSTKTFSLSYNTGEASGEIVSDDVEIAGYKAKNFEFGAATSVPNIFSSYNFSGVLGLPTNGSDADLPNLIEYMSEKDEVPEAKFALCMGSYSNDLNENNGGLFIIGKEVNSLMDGDLHTIDTLSESSNHWEVKVDGVFIDGYEASFKSMNIKDSETKVARLGLLDSGTTSIILTSADAITLHSYFPHSVSDGTQYAILCNSTIEISLEIGGHNWTITPDQYLGQAYDQSSSLAGYCVSNFQGLDSTTDGAWILGNIFLKKYYVEFNYGKSQVGLAERANAYVSGSGIGSTASATDSTSSDFSTSISGNSTESSTTTSSLSSSFTSTSSTSSSSSSLSSLSPSSSTSSTSSRSLANGGRLIRPESSLAAALLGLICLL